jgi:nicotinate-nucleotide adenylyltransferase
VPIAVIDRPASSLAPLHAPAAQSLADFRLREIDAPALAGRHPPAWCFLHGPRVALSSSELRRRGATA